MVFWCIVELHNGELNSVQRPYNSDMDAYDHLDKLKAHRKAHPVPIKITWKVTEVLHPNYVG